MIFSMESGYSENGLRVVNLDCSESSQYRLTKQQWRFLVSDNRRSYIVKLQATKIDSPKINWSTLGYISIGVNIS